MNAEDVKYLTKERVKMYDAQDLAKAQSDLLVTIAYQKGYDRAIEDMRAKIEPVKICNPKGLRGKWGQV